MKLITFSILIIVLLMASLLLPGRADAHCDTMDGPVVVDAIASLSKADVSGVLK